MDLKLRVKQNTKPKRQKKKHKKNKHEQKTHTHTFEMGLRGKNIKNHKIDAIIACKCLVCSVTFV